MHPNAEQEGGDYLQFVLVDHKKGRVLAHIERRQGALGHASWVPKRVACDMDSMGYNDVDSMRHSDTDSPGGSGNGELNDMGVDPGGRDGGGDEPHDDDGLQLINCLGGSNYDKYHREFQLVNARNIIIIPPSGKELLDILDEVEQCGDDKFIEDHLKETVIKRPEVYQYDRAVRLALRNYITGVAHGRVKYGVEFGFDAWRKLYNRYVLLAEDLQSI